VPLQFENYRLKLRGGIEVSEQEKGGNMRVKVVVSNKVIYEGNYTELKEEIASHSWEGYSSFSIKYDEEENLLVVEYWGEWPWLHIRGKEIKLF